MPHPFELEGCMSWRKRSIRRSTSGVRQVLEHLAEYPSLTAAETVPRREGVRKESVRRRVIQAQIDGGQRQGATSEELAEVKELKAKVRRLAEDNEILLRPRFSLRPNSTPATGDRGVR